MTERRRIIYYKDYFNGFVATLPKMKQRKKIVETIRLVQEAERIPATILKHVEGTRALYEIRVRFGSDVWRIFCFFGQSNTLVVLNGFQKKSNKTPSFEIIKALKLRDEYEKGR